MESLAPVGEARDRKPRHREADGDLPEPVGVFEEGHLTGTEARCHRAVNERDRREQDGARQLRSHAAPEVPQSGPFGPDQQRDRPDRTCGANQQQDTGEFARYVAPSQRDDADDRGNRRRGEHDDRANGR
jgi:hypothetical protein